MATRAKSPMWRWQRFSRSDERTGEVGKMIQLKTVRTGRSGVRHEEMRLRFHCEVGKKRWEVAVFVSNIIQASGGYVSPHIELGFQERAGPDGLWTVTSNKRGVVYSGDAREFARELVATERAGQTNLRIQLPGCFPRSGYHLLGDYTGTWNIKGVGAAVAWLEQQCGWISPSLPRPAPAVPGNR